MEYRMESMLSRSDESKAFVKEICFEFTQEAASLWLLRRKAVGAPHYNLTDLLEQDNRLEAQIDALRVAGDPGWEAAGEQLDKKRAEYFFAPSILAFESNDDNRIKTLLEKAQAAPDTIEAVISALEWMDWEQAQPHIKKLLTSKSSILQCVGIAASANHRQDPGAHLENAFYSGDATLRARSLKTVGELGGRGDKLMPGRLQDHLRSEDAAGRFWAAWSAVLLGDASAIDHLKPYVVDAQSPLRQEALQLAFRKLAPKDALIIHKQLTEKSDSPRVAAIAAGVIGDPSLLPWLLNQINIPSQARVAGEAFALITGVNLEKANLTGPRPEGFEAGPNDDPQDTNVEMDPDENLPWPDAKAVTAWWNQNKTKYETGKRYLLSKPITKENLQTLLQTGLQRQRTAAALELALLEPGKPLFNTAAPAWRQMPDVTPPPFPAIAPNYGSRQLAITAANCITPLGHTAAMTAASVRAGITAFRIYEDYNDQNGNPIIVARIQGLKGNLRNVVERIRSIAEICLDDLLKNYFKLNRRRPSPAHFFLGTSDEDRPGPDYGEESMIVLNPLIAKHMGSAAGEIIYKGNASFHHAVGEAARIISNQPDALCIIGCVDSLLMESILDRFESDKRLKSFSHGRHHGLIASEAVGFFIVEDLEQARQNKRPVLARIRSLGLAEESTPRVSGEIGFGQGLTKACHAALSPLKDQPVQNILGDLNGEDARAEEWTMAKGRCFPGKQALKLWKPAEYYGDVGASAGVTLACIAAEGFKRKWLFSPALIFCSDDFGPCGAIVLEKEETQFQGAR